MPAVTVEDPLSLPVVDHPALGVPARRVARLTDAPRGLEGEGFPVRRAFAGVPLAELDPFVHMDQMGEVDYAPGEPKGTPWHPHRGFETVTYMIEGTFVHRDSTGGGGRISDGDTQWMTAGSGILHIETPPEELVLSGGLFHGLQLWVNLPAAKKWVPPRYQDIGRHAVRLARSSDGGALIRLIAGRLGQLEGPGVTHTPITMVHLSLAPGAAVALPWAPQHNSLVYTLSGAGQAGAEGAQLLTGRLAVLSGDGSILLRADQGGSSLEVVLLGGAPIKEPVAHYGPFVMNTHQELMEAFEDFRAGRMGQIPPS